MKLKEIKQMLIDFKEELVKNEKSCNHNFLLVYKKSHVITTGYITYGICLDCNGYVKLRDDYDYIMNKSILIDATFGYDKFETVESMYETIDENLFDIVSKKYKQIKSNNSVDNIKSELEKVIEEYNFKKNKRV